MSQRGRRRARTTRHTPHNHKSGHNMLLVALGAISFIAPLSTPTRCAACCAVSETPQYFHAAASFPRVPHDSGFRSPRSAVTIKCLVTEADV